jgi:hypothetical protein
MIITGTTMARLSGVLMPTTMMTHTIEKKMEM